MLALVPSVPGPQGPESVFDHLRRTARESLASQRRGLVQLVAKDGVRINDSLEVCELD